MTPTLSERKGRTLVTTLIRYLLNKGIISERREDIEPVTGSMPFPSLL